MADPKSKNGKEEREEMMKLYVPQTLDLLEYLQLSSGFIKTEALVCKSPVGIFSLYTEARRLQYASSSHFHLHCFLIIA